MLSTFSKSSIFETPPDAITSSPVLSIKSFVASILGPLIIPSVEKFGDKIAVGVDAKNGMVAISGWEEVSDISAVDLCLKMKDYGVKTVIYTDISKDGMMSGPIITLEAPAFILSSTSCIVLTPPPV